ncbi:hypothetical protein BKA58DRAFT_31613 [Alternaria rosae]|uniref:uncharacterized protein n=1 Tax=Alternaria rosae TaxID=1187941 RepID=UPI001E8E633F|nr:uncharacterized protein BKA58DRAFT_31613 [Alternaria rosae]KAH6883163.1 hypothetical protein BKA58DRAFT_31613 [Alternaria rosae]
MSACLPCACVAACGGVAAPRKWLRGSVARALETKIVNGCVDRAARPARSQPIAPFHPPVQSPERRGKYLLCSSSRWSEHGSIEKEFVWKFDFQICAIVALKSCGIISKCLLSGIFLMINLIPRHAHAHLPTTSQRVNMRQCPPHLPCKTSMQDRAGPRIEVKRKRLHQTMSCIEAKLIVLYWKEETKERKQP